MKNIELYLGGLHCANCARKIEDKVSKMKETEDTRLNFVKKTLKFDLHDEIDEVKFVSDLKVIIDGIEPGLDIRVVGEGVVVEEHHSGGC